MNRLTKNELDYLMGTVRSNRDNSVTLSEIPGQKWAEAHKFEVKMMDSILEKLPHLNDVLEQPKVSIREACQKWFAGFNAIPQGLIEKLCEADIDSFHEITKPCVGDRVHLHQGADSLPGIITATFVGEDSEQRYNISNENGELICGGILESNFDLDNEYTDFLPMWGTMWTFGESIDDDWLAGNYCESGLQAMSDCGFRIYEHDEFGYVFGIDGAGYDFISEHFIPLYKERGLQWHTEEPMSKEPVKEQDKSASLSSESRDAREASSALTASSLEKDPPSLDR